MKMPRKKKTCGKTKGQLTKILKGVSGFAIPGETMFIMGSSGTGKTTLLNILAQREHSKQGVTVTGNITLNDEIPLTKEIFGKIGAYVTQDDVLYRFFTPREALTFAARLKLPG